MAFYPMKKVEGQPITIKIVILNLGFNRELAKLETNLRIHILIQKLGWIKNLLLELEIIRI